MFLVHAEDDRLSVAVGFLEKVGQVSGDGLRAGLEGDDSFKVFCAVFSVGNFPAVAVEFSLARPPACRIRGRYDPVDLVRGKKAVVNPLSETVGIERIAEITVPALPVDDSWICA
jgi:hypothetical protein